VGDRFQHQSAALGPVGTGVDGRALPPLYHAHHRLDLPPLAVTGQVKSLRHKPSIVSRRRLVGRASDLRRDQRANPQIVSRHAMRPLGVVAGIAQQRIHPRPAVRLADDPLEVRDVRPRTALVKSGNLGTPYRLNRRRAGMRW